MALFRCLSAFREVRGLLNFEVSSNDLSIDSIIQRLLSDNLPKIGAVETESNGQFYVWRENNG